MFYLWFISNSDCEFRLFNRFARHQKAITFAGFDRADYIFRLDHIHAVRKPVDDISAKMRGMIALTPIAEGKGPAPPAAARGAAREPAQRMENAVVRIGKPA